MSEMRNSTGKSKRVLFFGRAKCAATEELLDKFMRCDFDVTFVESRERGEKLSEEILWWEGEYIICFRSLYVLPKALLNKAKIAAINFHPAPPEYPGSGCINFALYDGAEDYGVTAHVMNELVDNGAILEVRRFPITPGDDLSTVLQRTHSELSNLCSDFISGIYSFDAEFIEKKLKTSKNVKWNGEARLIKEVNELQKVNFGISEDELKRVVRATSLQGHQPVIDLHGFKFRLDPEG